MCKAIKIEPSTVLEELLKLSLMDRKDTWVDFTEMVTMFENEGLDGDLSIRLSRIFCKYFYDEDSSWESRMGDIDHEWFNVIEDDADEMKVKVALRVMGKCISEIRRMEQ